MNILKGVSRMGDLALGNPPNTPLELHNWYISWHRLWVASAVLGGAWAYDSYRKKKWPMVAWGAGEAIFALYKMRMNEQAHRAWLQQRGNGQVP